MSRRSQTSNGDLKRTFPYHRVYKTGDGYLSVATNRGQHEKMYTVLAIVDEHIERNAGDIPDRAYFHQKTMMRAIPTRLKQNTTSHWLQVFEAVGVPCGQVGYRADLYTDPQAQALGMIWGLRNRDLGTYKASGHPMRFSKAPDACAFMSRW